MMAIRTVDIGFPQLALAYALLIIPFGLLLWYRIPMLGRTAVAVVRMTVQLLFVGVYLQFVFQAKSPWLVAAWLVVMLVVADFSILRGSGLRLGRFLLPVLAGLLVGTIVPLFFFLGVVLQQPNLLEAQYAIPIAGMILGNCLRAGIIGLRDFYSGIRASEKAFLHSLGQGARLHEAVQPFYRNSVVAALAPSVAAIATIGLVALPGMMTGVIIGGANPMTAIKYQIAIMIAILVGITLTITLTIWLTLTPSFTAYGTLDHAIFAKSKPRRTRGRGKR